MIKKVLGEEMLRNLLAVFLFFSSFQQVFAEELSVWGRAYHHSCGYYSSTYGDAHITYKNENLPWGSKVNIIYGLEGITSEHRSGEAIDWYNRQWTEAHAIDKWTWKAEISVGLHYRSSPRHFDTLDFVVEVILPDGHVFYDNGSLSVWGFYKARFPSQIACLRGDESVDSIDFDELDLDIEVRD